jgi:hypothetical protein
VVVGARRAGMVAMDLAALTMGLAFAHTLELPQKLDYDAAPGPSSSTACTATSP